MTTEQPEALQLADDLDAEAGRITQYTNSRGSCLASTYGSFRFLQRWPTPSAAQAR